MALDRSFFMLPNDQPVVPLDCTKAFKALTQTEKLYAHHLSEASWKGGLIVLLQTSPESPLIFLLLHKLFRSQSLPSLRAVALERCNFSEDDFQGLLVYTAGILSNMGNYRGLGGSKIIPNVPQDKFKSLLGKSAAYESDPELMKFLWKNCGGQIFSLNDSVKQLGFSNKGITTYFSSNCTEEDSNVVNKFLEKMKIEAQNNRVFKSADGNTYEIRCASEIGNEAEEERALLGTHQFEGKSFKVTRGDYGPLMGLVNKSLEEAKKYTANETQVKVLEKYIQSFRTGLLAAHKQGSTLWMEDKVPIIETYIGFVAKNRDPSGQRGEFESFVAMINKERSAKFAALVEDADRFIALLPWPASFENGPAFVRPDFTTLDVLTFGGSGIGIPDSINLPNYEEIKQNVGTKHITLGNVVPAKLCPAFLTTEDEELLVKYRSSSYEVHVGLQKLLGHGSGKLFIKNANGTYNFDDQNVTNPITGEKISSWYEEGETFESKFLSLAGPLEECRTEAVGLFLSLKKDVLKIFGFEGKEADDVTYANWLRVLMTAVKDLESYQPETQVWSQAQSQARFAILRALLEAEGSFVMLNEVVGNDGKPDLRLSVDRNKLDTEGKATIATLLEKLQVYKTTANVESATALFRNYSVVSNEGVPFLTYRDIALDRRQPIKTFVQPNTSITGNEVSLKSYDVSFEGLIQSWMERFPSNMDLVAILKPLWESEHGR